MDKLAIDGGVALDGEVRVSGAKNAALPILCAALLTPEPLTLANVPELNDVRTMRALLAQMGVHRRRRRRRADAVGGACRLAARAVRDGEDDARVDPGARAAARALRRSARVACRAAAPSGCGRSTSTSRACRRWARRSTSITATSTPRRSVSSGTRFVFDVVTVTGTENLMMAATLADGTTVLENAAREPEVVDLADCLNAMGAHDQRRRHRPHRDRGRDEPARRHATRSCPIASRRARSWPLPRRPAATSRCAGTRPDTLGAVLDKLAEAGATIDDRRRRRSASRAAAGSSRRSRCAPRRIRRSRPTCRRS